MSVCLTYQFLDFCFCSLLNLCSVKNQDAVLKLAVATLDYSRDGLARVILSKILTAATDVRATTIPGWDKERKILTGKAVSRIQIIQNIKI